MEGNMDLGSLKWIVGFELLDLKCPLFKYMPGWMLKCVLRRLKPLKLTVESFMIRPDGGKEKLGLNYCAPGDIVQVTLILDAEYRPEGIR
jgi:hypothetical protein